MDMASRRAVSGRKTGNCSGNRGSCQEMGGGSQAFEGEGQGKESRKRGQDSLATSSLGSLVRLPQEAGLLIPIVDPRFEKEQSPSSID